MSTLTEESMVLAADNMYHSQCMSASLLKHTRRIGNLSPKDSHAITAASDPCSCMWKEQTSVKPNHILGYHQKSFAFFQFKVINCSYRTMLWRIFTVLKQNQKCVQCTTYVTDGVFFRVEVIHQPVQWFVVCSNISQSHCSGCKQTILWLQTFVTDINAKMT